MKTLNYFSALLFSILLIHQNLDAQTTLNCQWGNFATSGIVTSRCVTTDNNGNVYVLGDYDGIDFYFGADTISYPSFGANNTFFAKYDVNGTLLFVKTFGDPVGFSPNNGYSIVTDVNNNVYISGTFYSSILFDTITLNGTSGVGTFLVKYNPNGNLIWVKTESNTGFAWNRSMAIDQSGNIIVTGNFALNPITFDTTTLYSSGGSDIFVVKYDSNGNVIWAKSAGGNSSEEPVSISSDYSGNILITGTFVAPFIFGSDTINSFSNIDLFILKYDQNGNEMWGRSGGGNQDDNSVNITADGIGNVYLSGDYLSSNITFGTITVNNSGGSASPATFLVKFDPNGNVIWAKSTECLFFHLVKSDFNGNLTVVGNNDCWSNFEVIGNDTIKNQGNLIAQFDSNGNGVRGAAGGLPTKANSFAIDINNDIILSGKDNSYLVPCCSIINPYFISGTGTLFVSKYSNLATGIKNDNISGQLSIYPNPVTDKLIVKNENNKESSIFIYDLSSRLLFQQSFKSTALINTGGLANGLYIYHILQDGLILKTGKFVKE